METNRSDRLFLPHPLFLDTPRCSCGQGSNDPTSLFSAQISPPISRLTRAKTCRSPGCVPWPLGSAPPAPLGPSEARDQPCPEGNPFTRPPPTQEPPDSPCRPTNASGFLSMSLWFSRSDLLPATLAGRTGRGTVGWEGQRDRRVERGLHRPSRACPWGSEHPEDRAGVSVKCLHFAAFTVGNKETHSSEIITFVRHSKVIMGPGCKS